MCAGCVCVCHCYALMGVVLWVRQSHADWIVHGGTISLCINIITIMVQL